MMTSTQALKEERHEPTASVLYVDKPIHCAARDTRGSDLDLPLFSHAGRPRPRLQRKGIEGLS